MALTVAAARLFKVRRCSCPCRRRRSRGGLTRPADYCGSGSSDPGAAVNSSILAPHRRRSTKLPSRWARRIPPQRRAGMDREVRRRRAPPDRELTIVARLARPRAVVARFRPALDAYAGRGAGRARRRATRLGHDGSCRGRRARSGWVLGRPLSCLRRRRSTADRSGSGGPTGCGFTMRHDARLDVLARTGVCGQR
jgi:hypothetical protein